MNVIIKNSDCIDSKIVEYQNHINDILFGYLMAGFVYLAIGGMVCLILESILLFIVGAALLIGSFVFILYTFVRIQHEMKESCLLFAQAYLSSIKTTGKLISFCFQKNKDSCYKTNKDFWCLSCSYLADLDEDTIIVDYKKEIVYVSGLYLLKK